MRSPANMCSLLDDWIRDLGYWPEESRQNVNAVDDGALQEFDDDQISVLTVATLFTYLKNWGPELVA